ncbi:MAG: hypothetical protein LiPW30_740 [Parcubacteria group bacterium LiPW_30]|nr:MAG: hypothetical protein LiPW30_740 [Parcubacteria group bacterium LiPW_30]
MPRQTTLLANQEIYHIVLRAVGDSIVFKDEKDYYRGIFSIYEFNNFDSVSIRDRREQRKKEKLELLKVPRSPTSGNLNGLVDMDKRKKMVEILAFCFMPNHIHLLARQLKDNGISQFMQKVGGGYANYSNKKYNRKGHLFSQFRAIHIKTDEQLYTVFVYIHANCISLIEPGWKENGIKNPEKVIKFLNNFKWSSYPDYIGKTNFLSVTEREFMLKVMGNQQGCREALESWVKYKKRFKDFGDIVLE